MAKIHEADTVPSKTLGPQDTRRLDPVQVDPLLRAAAIEEQLAYRRRTANQYLEQQSLGRWPNSLHPTGAPRQQSELAATGLPSAQRLLDTQVVDMNDFRRRAEIEEIRRRTVVRKKRRIGWFARKLELVRFVCGQIRDWVMGYP